MKIVSAKSCLFLCLPKLMGNYDKNINPVRNLAKSNWYVYALKSLKDRCWYIGCTSNLIKRLKEHNDGKVYTTKPKSP